MIVVVCLVACFASLLTFYSGFGLGTLLTPVLAFFFPIETAIALTGVVHLLNNLFKFLLVYKNINLKVVLAFGIPAFLFAFLGAWLLGYMANLKTTQILTVFSHQFTVIPVKLLLGVLLIVFALLELVPAFKQMQLKGGLLAGGALTGFFGGLTGNQGALRAAFLLRLGLSKEAFIGTGVAIALCIDLSRVSMYFNNFIASNMSQQWPLLTAATSSAFLGAWLGNKWLKKVSIKFISYCVGFFLIFIGVMLILGLI